MQLKTLIIVHKEFLMQQWINRINQFLPQANIGIIQRNNINVDNKDIVIGMLQSISMKDYDDNIFTDFGLTIIDECHHIPSRVFSRIIFKINTKHIIGLSATPERYDGLEKVLYWGIGNVLYYLPPEKNDNVDVIIHTYYTNESYDVPINKYTHKPNISKIISDICDDNDRTNTILSIIESIDDDRQILIISDRLSQLDYIYDHINKSRFTCGKFIGNSSEDEREYSMTCDIILSTYGLSKEGLDIPSLNTIILATPRRDINQTIGRIMRGCSLLSPLIIDICDKNIIPLCNQFYTRLLLYKSRKYSIKYNNNDYSSHYYDTNDNVDNCDDIYNFDDV